MPLITYVVDDKSPLISYDSTWHPGIAQDDPFATDYYLGTFTKNNVTDGSVSFNFNGTAVWIYGSFRPHHGSFTVQVDSAIYAGLNSAGDYLFQQSLFNVSSLSQGTHALKLTNTASGGLYVVIDMIVWQSQVGTASDQLVSEIVQDTDSRFQYQESAWSATSSLSNINFQLFDNGSGHLAQTYNASVIFTFTGMHIVNTPLRSLTHNLLAKAVSLFGTSGPSNGMYSVQLDGGQSVQYNASNGYTTNYGVMIYHTDNLSPGSHQLVLTNLPATSEQSLCIDHAQLWTVANTASTGNPPSNTNTLSSGEIAGMATAVAAAALSAGLALLFYRRWKATIATQQDHYRAIALRQGILESSAVASTGFSSSIGAGSSVPTSIRNDAPTLGISEGAPQFDMVTQDHVPGIAPVDEDSTRRPLPGAPGGGMSLSDEFPKLTGPRRRQSVMSADHASITVSEAPPNYTQAIGNVTTIDE